MTPARINRLLAKSNATFNLIMISYTIVNQRGRPSGSHNSFDFIRLK